MKTISYQDQRVPGLRRKCPLDVVAQKPRQRLRLRYVGEPTPGRPRLIDDLQQKLKKNNKYVFNKLEFSYLRTLTT